MTQNRYGGGMEQKIVPREPTPEMREAMEYVDIGDGDDIRPVWRAGYDAAPSVAPAPDMSGPIDHCRFCAGQGVACDCSCHSGAAPAASAAPDVAALIAQREDDEDLCIYLQDLARSAHWRGKAHDCQVLLRAVSRIRALPK